MGRIVITNSENYYKEALRLSTNAGFHKFNKYISMNSLFLAVYKKKLVKNENFYQAPEGDFVCSVGTLIHKEGKFGINALNRIYDDFDEDIPKLRERLLGTYAICIRKFNRLFVFTDKYEIFALYYFAIENEWFISNSLSIIAEIIDNKEINEFGLIQECFHGGCVGNDTVMNNVYRLLGIECIEIDLKSSCLKFKNVPYTKGKNYSACNNLRIQDMVDYYSELVREKFSLVKKIFNNEVRIHVTGGLDSRTVLAGFMSVDCKPSITYGIEGKIFLFTGYEDLKIHKLIANKMDLDTYLMNWKWSNSFIKNSKDEDLYTRYGFNYRFYGFNKNCFIEYENLHKFAPLFLEAGYFGENLRLREWAAENISTTFTIDEFIENYQINSQLLNNITYIAVDDYKEYLKQKFRKYSNIYNIPQSGEGVFHINQFDELRQLLARHSDSYVVNFLNEFTYSISMFSTTELYEYPFSIPAYFRKNAKFQLLLIKNLFPTLLEIPLFSHGHKVKVNNNSNSLTEMEDIKSKSVKLSNHIKILHILLKIYKKLRKYNYKNVFISGVKNYLIREIQEVEKQNNIISLKNYDFSKWSNIVPVIYYFSYIRKLRK